MRGWAAIILCVGITHVYWGVALCFSPIPADVAPIAHMKKFVPEHVVLGVLLGAIGIGSLVSLILKRDWLAFPLILPQQFAAMYSAYGGLLAAFAERYPDGTERPFLFISSDQFLYLAVAIMHSAAIWSMHLHDLLMRVLHGRRAGDSDDLRS